MAAASIFSLAFCAALAWPGASGGSPRGRLILRRQAAEGGGSSVPASQRLFRRGNLLVSDYGFENFNRDSLNVEFSIARKAFLNYEAAFGVTDSRIGALRRGRDGARLEAYLEAHGFRMNADGSFGPDIPGIVRENEPLTNSLARAFAGLDQSLGYRTGDLLAGAAAAMVQTAIRYQVPPDMADGRHTAGMQPPLSVLVRGWGDCATKSALLGALLGHWPNLRPIGIAVPGHYLIAVPLIPNKDDLFVDYGGRQYVLIESAGPAWLPPGTVSDYTQSLLQAGNGYRIEPFF